MTKVIGVRFKANGKSYYFSPGDLELQQGDHVIVETARGTECGEVAKGPHDVPDSSIVKPLKTVTRMADAVDVRRMQQNRADEKRAFFQHTIFFIGYRFQPFIEGVFARHLHR